LGNSAAPLISIQESSKIGTSVVVFEGCDATYPNVPTR
jgi:hypothetical protein